MFDPVLGSLYLLLRCHRKSMEHEVTIQVVVVPISCCSMCPKGVPAEGGGANWEPLALESGCAND